MASSLYNLALDFSKELNYTKAIMARQGDKGITVTVKPFLNGLQMDTSGGTFTLKGTTPSNRYVDSVATSVTSEEVTFSLDGTFMSEAGYYKHCYVEYRKDNQILTTQDIIFFSLGVSDISQGQADEYVSQLEELIRKYNETFDAFMDEIKGRVDSLNKQITDLTGQAKTLQDKLDALKEEISKLGNLQVMYSNSIDFGDYDYSGNHNLAITNSDTFKSGTGGPVTYAKGEYTVHMDGSGRLSRYNVNPETSAYLKDKTQYTMSCEIYVGSDYTGDITQIFANYAYADGGYSILQTSRLPSDAPRNTWITVRGTSTIDYQGRVPKVLYFTWQTVSDTVNPTGTLKIRKLKIEHGADATPYQPNLLQEPYQVSKVALNNHLDTNGMTPVNTSNYLIYTYSPSEFIKKGSTFTIRLEGTKPSDKSFKFYMYKTKVDGTVVSNDFLGDMVQVEGLKNTWELVVNNYNFDDTELTQRFRLYQHPNSNLGAVSIKWCKIEYGTAATPPITFYKYFGEGLKDSNNPNDYSWDITPEYVEDNLATDVKISEIIGKANNYTDGKVSEINSQLTASIHAVDTTAKDAQTKANANATAIKNLDTSLTKKINDNVTQYGVEVGDWINCTMNGDYIAGDHTTPRFRVVRYGNKRKVEFDGAVGHKSGKFPTTAGQQVAINVPEGYRPAQTAQSTGSTSYYEHQSRLAVTTAGSFYVSSIGQSNLTYVYISSMDYWID